MKKQQKYFKMTDGIRGFKNSRKLLFPAAYNLDFIANY